MPFAPKVKLKEAGPSGYKIFARGVVPYGGGVIGNPLNVASVSGVQSLGYCAIDTLTPIPANSICICRPEGGPYIAAGCSFSGTILETQFYKFDVSPFARSNCKFSFEIWQPE